PPAPRISARRTSVAAAAAAATITVDGSLLGAMASRLLSRLVRSVPMLLSKGSVKLRSLWLSPLVFGLASIGSAGMAGCFFFDDHHDSKPDVVEGGSNNPTTGGDTNVNNGTDPPAQTDPGTGVTVVSIEPDKLLDANGGEGVGIFVEVTSAGQ